MLKGALALGLATALTGSAFAADAVEAKTDGPRVVYVCDSSELTTRSFEREFGAQAFVTAEDALKASREQEVWSAPRCMTNGEFAKLAELTAQRADAPQLAVADK